MPAKERILVAALDWGLGHATRTAPLIRQLQEKSEVTLASAGAAADFYRKYFPELKLLVKPAYSIRYWKNFPFAFSILLQLPKIILAIWREHAWLKRMIQRHNFDRVISDNCYGLYSSNVHTVFITHQLKPITPPALRFMEPVLKNTILRFIKKFDECIVPDYPASGNLSGELSHFGSVPSNVKYSGPLSRFNAYSSISEAYDVCIILSGPEPQRSDFESKCTGILKNLSLKSCIIRGMPATGEIRHSGAITFYDHAEDDLFVSILKNSRLIISRSGYSTIMDLHALGLTALLVPSPGQTEQEYLAKYLSGKNLFQFVEEKNFDATVINASLKQYQEL
jgi:uncharacterized protein (TIGR00661 family)